MVKLYDFKESSVISWAHETPPLLAAGTLAGVMDDNFSSDSSLSIYNPFAKDSTPIFRGEAPAKFHSIDWSIPSDQYKRGIIAGALENTNIQLWDAEKVLSTNDLAASSIATYSKHTTPVLKVAFNPLQSHILGSSASKGEIFIWDTNKGSSFTPGQAMSPMAKVSCLEWNNSMSHIFGTAGDGGYASIWDLKAKREVLQLTYQGLNMSVLQWHPSQSTKLVTATDSDSEPVILTWDLRNSSVPEMVIKGHKKGILSLDWCKQDPSLLLSSGKDDSTKLWNPLEGIEIASYPSLPNWVQQTKFAPNLPEIFASASLSKNVIVQTLQDTSDPVSVKVQSKNDDEFWNQISTTETQKPVFHVSQAPAWLKRPVSASFGFGGKLVIAEGKNVSIVNVAKNGEMDKSAKELITALSSDDYKLICQSKIQSEIKLEERKDWELLNDLLANGKAKTIDDLMPVEENSISNDDKSELDSNKDDGEDDDFFAQLGSAKNVENKSKYLPSGKFNLFDNKSEFEADAIKLILNNKTDDALDLCIANERLLEALIIAMNGSDSMKSKARGAYFAKFANESSFSRLLYSASTTDVSDVVENVEIDESSWKDVAKSIVAFSKGTPNFEKEMKILGNRLMDSNIPNSRDIAFKCYVAADALDKIAAIWLGELEAYEKLYLETANENGEKNTSFEARFKALGEVIEKTIVFESICHSKSSDGLEPLGKAFQEYANYLANFGHFELAYKILEKVNDSIPGIKEEKNRITKAFFKKSTEKASVRASKGYGMNQKFNTPQSTMTKPTSNYVNPLVPNAALAPSNPYSIPPVPSQSTTDQPSVRQPVIPHANNRPINRYAPKTAIELLQNPSPVQAQQSSMPPPPPKKKDVGGWNDLPKGLSNAPKPVSASLPTAYSAPSPVIANPAGFSMPNAVPPPPTAGHSRSPSATYKPVKTTSRNPYQPKPEAIEPVRVSSNVAVSPLVQPAVHLPPVQAAQKSKNPYAPNLESNQSGFNSASSNGSAAVPLPPSQRNAYAPPPQKNAYAPSPPQQPMTGMTQPPQANAYAIQNNNGTVPPSSYPPPKAHNPYAPSVSPQPVGMASPGVPPPIAPPKRSNIVPPPPMKKIATLPPAAQVEAAEIAAAAAAASSVPQQTEHVEVSPEIMAIESILSTKLEAVKPGIPEKFQKQVQDSGKRLSILFADLKRGEIDQGTISTLIRLTNALDTGDFETAKSCVASIGESEGGKWLAGIKRLIGMAEVTNND